ncbi:uncharacterized protein LOC110634205 [Hevea brasiliensis]|uniref:uncharacterized protein LOC110634205 n=1 Tax=Hevea brasiliensis TaxID=3981 RepID=UPI0025EFCC79|nr:uncharacterized protein LOC110634205 [Hevea brasiliensis]
MALIKAMLKIIISKQKSYVDFHKKEVVLQEGDMLLLKVSPMKGVIRFRKKDSNKVISKSDMEISKDLSYIKQPIQIVDMQIRRLRNREIPMVEVLQSHHNMEECTWETRDSMF